MPVDATNYTGVAGAHVSLCSAFSDLNLTQESTEGGLSSLKKKLGLKVKPKKRSKPLKSQKLAEPSPPASFDLENGVLNIKYNKSIRDYFFDYLGYKEGDSISIQQVRAYYYNYYFEEFAQIYPLVTFFQLTYEDIYTKNNASLYAQTFRKFTNAGYQKNAFLKVPLFTGNQQVADVLESTPEIKTMIDETDMGMLKENMRKYFAVMFELDEFKYKLKIKIIEAAKRSKDYKAYWQVISGYFTRDYLETFEPLIKPKAPKRNAIKQAQKREYKSPEFVPDDWDDEI